MLKPNSPVTANLIKARELIIDPKNWCQGTMFCGQQMCAIGALANAGVNLITVGPEIFILQRAAEELFHEPMIAEVNDALGHTATMRMFSRAIELSLLEEYSE